MKKRLKSFATLCVFGFSLMSSLFTAEALDELSYTISNTEMEINESVYLPNESVIMSEYLPSVDYQYNEDSYNFYDQLDENNKAAYNAMKAWAEPTEEELTISLPVTITHTTETTDMSEWTEEEYSEFWDSVFKCIQYGKDAVMLDYPEIFWIDLSAIKLTISDVRISQNIFTGMYSMKISELRVKGNIAEEYTDLETAKEFKQLLDDSVEAFDVVGDDRYQQIKYIHDYIANAVTYNISAPYHNASVGLFCEPYEIVCEGYSKSFKLICDKIGIPCVVIPGNINITDNTGHMWNYVMMENGEWYGIDCTWDDLNNTLNPIKYEYFLKGSDNFNQKHTADSQYYTFFEYPELSTDDYIYASEEPIVTTVTTAPITTTTSTTITTTEPITTIITTTPITTTTTSITTTIPITTTITATTTTPVTTTTTFITTTPVTTTLPQTTSLVPSHIEGDYNLDGIVNIADAVELRAVLIGIKDMDKEFPNDDLNDDNVINLFDYMILSRRLLGGT